MGALNPLGQGIGGFLMTRFARKNRHPPMPWPQLNQLELKKPPEGGLIFWGLFFRGRQFGQQTGFNHLQAVVTRKIHHEVPSHDVVLAQIMVDHHTLDATQRRGNAPGGIAQVAARCGATGSKLAHDARQTFSPIAGPERLAILGDALDENFFGSVGNHRIEV